MRQIQVVVPAGQGWSIFEELKKEYSYMDLIDGRTSDLLLITVSDGICDVLVKKLTDLGVSLKHGTITITNTTARLPNISRKARSGNAINREELREDMQRLSSLDRTFISYVILSAFIAAIGIISDNLVILIASMIVAPLMQPMVSTSFSILTNNSYLLKRSLRKEALGFILTILIGVMAAIVIPVYTINSTMQRTATITVLDLLVALVGGIAAGVSVTQRQQSELIGIAVAASICPPATSIGINLWQYWNIGSTAYVNLTIGSVSLLGANVLAIHLTTLVIFWLQGVKPTAEWKRFLSKGTIRRRTATMLLLIGLIGIPISAISLDSYQQWSNESSMRKIILDELGEENILDIEIVQSWDSPILPKLTEVNITIQLVNASYTLTQLEASINNIKLEIKNTVLKDPSKEVNIKLLVIASNPIGDI